MQHMALRARLRALSEQNQRERSSEAAALKEALKTLNATVDTTILASNQERVQQVQAETGPTVVRFAKQLFLDDRWVASSTNVEASIGETFLLPGALEDPTTYIGWGYPAVFRLPGGGFRALYEGWANKSFHGTRMVLVADSADGVAFTPLNVSLPPPRGWPPSFSYDCSKCPSHKCSSSCGRHGPPHWPPNAVLGPILGFVVRGV